MRDYGTARRSLFAPSDAVRSITLPRRSAIKCNALNLSRYWKTGLSAESQPPSTVAVGWGLDCLPANGSLSRAAALPLSAVDQVAQKPLIRTFQWLCTPFFGDLWDQEFLSCASILPVSLTTDEKLVNHIRLSKNRYFYLRNLSRKRRC